MKAGNPCPTKFKKGAIVILLNHNCFPAPRKKIMALPRRQLPGGSKRRRAIAVNPIREGRHRPNTERAAKEPSNPPGEERV
jgi:hypothetical protein